MKQIVLSVLMLVGITSYAQVERDITELDETNSWLKAGLNVTAPAGVISNTHAAAVAIDVSGQFMRTNHFGFGVTTGYSQYIADNEDGGLSGFGLIPAAAMLRYYPYSTGFFAGIDAGYTFTTNTAIDGGLSIRPHVGYHNYDWNIFGFVNNVWSNNYSDITSIGVGVTYNIRFK